MKKAINFFAAGIFIISLFMSCKSDPIATPPRTDIHLDSNAQAGSHIVDKDGRSLYYFSNDANGLSNCTGGCLSAWPIFKDSTNTTLAMVWWRPILL